MQITTVYYALMVTLFATGVRCMFRGFGRKTNIRYRAGPVHSAKKLYTALTDTSEDRVFATAGIHMGLHKYKTWQKLIITIFLFLCVVNLMEGSMELARKWLLVAIILYGLSYPSHTMRGRKTPFGYVMNMLQSRNADAMDEELTGIIIQMKNIIISGKQELSANYIIMRLLPFTKLTKKAFAVALMHIRRGETEAAAHGFDEEFGTKLGTTFAGILLKLDELPAREFLEQLDMVQKKAEAQHQTRKEAKKVRISTLRRLFATIEAVLIMGNFVYLILIDTLSIMNF